MEAKSILVDGEGIGSQKRQRVIINERVQTLEQKRMTITLPLIIISAMRVWGMTFQFLILPPPPSHPRAFRHCMHPHMQGLKRI